MDYDFRAIEDKWQKRWKEDKTYKVSEDPNKEKYYVLDMFPYPSGAGLHVGHPLGYIASDIYARYKRHLGFNVLHPMGYDSFGLPAEQYAIQTGQHPAITTEQNINRYREQLDLIGFSYDWEREVRTSSPEYYKWTQWIFTRLFESWYNNESDKAENLDTLIAKFESGGSVSVNAPKGESWWQNDDGSDFSGEFSAEDWAGFSDEKKAMALMNYRLTYLADSMVNWCPELGTVLANDEVKDGLSERGGHPVVQKLMRQWSMRISAYAQRLLDGLETIDWTDSIKEVQRNWIGRSEGASIHFAIDGCSDKIEVFSTRPDTIFGVSFMVLAPEHELVDVITLDDYKEDIEAYKMAANAKTERDRQSDVKNVTGQFTGAYAVHPFTGKQIPIWIADYVLAGYGTGAVMAVPAGDQRDFDFAKKFDIPIPNIFEGIDIDEEAASGKNLFLRESDFLNGKPGHEAIEICIQKMEEMCIGEGKINYRLRDAVFSRQRYWGEPFPIYYENGFPHLVCDNEQVTLPPIDKYLPTEDGDPPLANAKKEDWNLWKGERMEYNTMPGWAGSSWYFLRYMDPNNYDTFCDRSKSDYWKQVDLYIGGSEHATGHLLYSRFWTKFLYDLDLIPFDEPFAKMINQGMILGRSSFVYRVKGTTEFVSFEKRKDYETQRLHIDISMVDNDILDTDKFKNWRPEFANATFVFNDDGQYVCGNEIDKMSKRWHNVVNPDDLCEKYGADTLRCYEMFLGPLEQAKPWDVKGINGVHNFLRKVKRLADASIGERNSATPEHLKTLHKTIKKIGDDLDRYSWNTCVSAMMICINELTDGKCSDPAIMEQFCVLLSPYAPHLSEEIWQQMGHDDSIVFQPWPVFDEQYLKEDDFEYPISFNGKMRFKMSLPADWPKEQVQEAVMSHEKTVHYLEGKDPKKVIVVLKRIVNIVV